MDLECVREATREEMCDRCAELEIVTPASFVVLVDGVEVAVCEDHDRELTRVTETVHTLLGQLPAGYPPAKFSQATTGYRLEIGSTIIFQGASAEDAIKHTKNYVEAREGHPDLPVGVIYGIYD